MCMKPGVKPLDHSAQAIRERSEVKNGSRTSGLVKSAFVLAFSVNAGAAIAADQRVIELFTSQGCSSCPPADALAAKWAGNPRAIVLSFPVEYWDYIGWKDTLASPAFTARQKAYAKARGDGHVYTPQAVINGAAHAVGSDQAQVDQAVASTSGRNGALSVPLAMSETATGLHVEVGAVAAGAAAVSGTVFLVNFTSRSPVAIGRGENAGHTVTYVNVVRDMTALGTYAGAAAQFEVPASELRRNGSDGYVVMVQAGTASKPGVVLAAAKSK